MPRLPNVLLYLAPSIGGPRKLALSDFWAVTGNPAEEWLVSHKQNQSAPQGAARGTRPRWGPVALLGTLSISRQFLFLSIVPPP